MSQATLVSWLRSAMLGLWEVQVSSPTYKHGGERPRTTAQHVGGVRQTETPSLMTGGRSPGFAKPLFTPVTQEPSYPPHKGEGGWSRIRWVHLLAWNNALINDSRYCPRWRSRCGDDSSGSSNKCPFQVALWVGGVTRDPAKGPASAWDKKPNHLYLKASVTLP